MIKTYRFVPLVIALLWSTQLKAQTPPATWQEHWFEHNQLVSLFFYDNDVVIYYDNNMDPSITWMNTYVGDAWRYTKQLYGNMNGGGTDQRLWAVFHQNRYGGGHPGYYYESGHDYRNTIDLAQSGSWYNPTGWALDATIHEIGHIVESTTNNSNGSPAFPIWGDSKWCVIYQYDVYVALGWNSEATRWYNEKLSDPWFTNWFYPIWRDYGHGQVLKRFFQLLAQYYPKNGQTYARNMNWGEFLHFWSGAANTNLKALAQNTITWTAEYEAQFLQAQQDFPLPYAYPNGMPTDITDLGGTITAQYTDSPAAEGIGNLIDNISGTKFLTFHNASWVQFQATQSYIVDSYSIRSANDADARDPLSWTLQASNDGANWTTLDTRSGEDFPSRFQRRTFSFTNNTAYTYYRLNLTNNSGSTLQLSEIELFKKADAVDITSLGGTVSAQYTDSPAAEGIGNIIDDNVNTKYLTFHNAGWIQFQSTTSRVVEQYSITSANDAPDRDPLTWTLQGSNNGTSWTTLDTRSGEDFPNRYQTRVFSITNSTAYTYYRFNLTNNSGSILQLAEIELFQAGSASLPSSARALQRDVKSITEEPVSSLIYPNPTYGSLQLKFTGKRASITISDALGQERIPVKAVQSNEVIDISHLDKGLYFIQVDIDGVRKTERIIKK